MSTVQQMFPGIEGEEDDRGGTIAYVIATEGTPTGYEW